MSTPLYKQMLAYEYRNTDRVELMRKVWSVTPFMIDCFTGEINSERERGICDWLRENIGEQAYPFHERSGEWQLGSATINGWTWLGFAKQEQLDAFLAAFPDAVKWEEG